MVLGFDIGSIGCSFVCVRVFLTKFVIVDVRGRIEGCGKKNLHFKKLINLTTFLDGVIQKYMLQHIVILWHNT
jgi:hypothetical protein